MYVWLHMSVSMMLNVLWHTGEDHWWLCLQLWLGGRVLRLRRLRASEERGRHMLRLHAGIVHGHLALRQDDAHAHGQGGHRRCVLCGYQRASTDRRSARH